jgi:hypothetical protein
MLSTVIGFSDFVMGQTENEQPQNTTILFPSNNSTVSGIVKIRVQVITCNCTGTTSLYVNDNFISNGTRLPMTCIGGIWYENFIHEWNTSSVSNGQYQIKVLEKHKQYSDQFVLHVNNSANANQAAPTQPQNTIIVSPSNNSTVSGLVEIIADCRICFCIGKTSLYIDGVFISDGNRTGTSEHDGIGYERFVHAWNASSVPDGSYQIKVLGKHKEYSDEITVIVNQSYKAPEDGQTDGKFIPSFDGFCVIGAIALSLAAISIKKKFR